MRIGTTSFEYSVSRVAKAADSVVKRKLEHGRESIDASWTSAVRLVFSVADACLYLFATNGSVFAYDKIDVEVTDKDKEDFTAYIYCTHLLDHLSVSSGLVEFYKYRDGVRIAPSERQKFYLRSHGEMEKYFETFGKVAEIPECPYMLINAMIFKDALGFTSYVANGDIPEDKSLLIEAVDNQLCFGATDRWRLAIAKNVIKTDLPIKCAIYSDLIGRLDRMIEYEDADISLYFGKSVLYIRDCDFTAGALVSERAHDIWGVIKTFPEMNILFSPDVDVLRRALNVSEHFAENGAGYAAMSLSDNKANLSAVAQETGSTMWVLESSEKATGNLDVLFNPRAVAEFITRTKPKNIMMSFSGQKTPFSITGDNPDRSLIVMPINISHGN